MNYRRIYLLAVFIFWVNIYSQWIEQVSGVSVSLNSAASSNWLRIVWICGNNGTVLRTTNLGTNWINVSGNGIPQDVNLNTISDSYVNSAGAFVSGVRNDSAFVYRTSNNGANWNIVFRQLNGRINGIDVNYQSGFMVGNPVGGRWSVWKTTNDGINWDSIGLFIPQNNNEAGINNSFVYTTDNIFFGTNNNRVYYSLNNGANWSAITFTNLSSVTGIDIISFTGGQYQGYLAGPERILFTSNSGVNWVSDSLIPGSGNIVGIAKQNLPVEMIGDYNLFITRGDNKIWYSANSGNNWLTSYTAPSGIYTHISNRIPEDYFAVRNNGGISYCGCRIINVSQISNEIPKEFTLYQNYPNPFNPVTNIKFDIPKSGFVQITIYDLLGREITTLVNQQMQPGSYSVDWDAANYPSGVYFYSLVTENYTETKKMVLIK